MVTKAAMFIAGVLALSAPVSYFITDYMIQRAPIPAQIMVVDVSQVIGNGTGGNAKDAAASVEAKTAALKGIVQEAVSRGIVVIDADAVIKAPDAAYITLPTN